MSKNTKRSALFGILSIVLWCLMAIPMIVLIALADVGRDAVARVICFGSIIPNIAGLVLGILGFILGRRGDATRVGRKLPLRVRLILISPILGILLNVAYSWPVFALWYVGGSLSGIVT